MSPKVPLTRISVTVPRDVLLAADRRAKALDRSRSWLVAEALRRYRPDAAPSDREVEGAADVAKARQYHLATDLELSAEERLRRAEELVRLAPRPRAAARAQVIGFSSYEDFYAWKRARLAEGLPRT